MQTYVEVAYFRQGHQLGASQILTNTIEDPSWFSTITLDEIVTWLGDIGQAIGAYVKNDWVNLAKAGEDFFKTLVAGNYSASFTVKDTLVWWQGGQIDPWLGRADMARLTFHAASGSDLKGGASAKLLLPPGQPGVTEMPGTGYPDKFRFQQGFEIRLDQRRPTTLALVGQAGDTGFVSVGIATTIAIVLAPAIRQLRHSGWMTQSNFGSMGNFELVAPANTGLAYYWRDNDNAELPWTGPIPFLEGLGRVTGVSMLQSTFADRVGLGWMMAAAVTDQKKAYLLSRDDGRYGLKWTKAPFGAWPAVSGVPALIQSSFDAPPQYTGTMDGGNLEVVVPLDGGGLLHWSSAMGQDGWETFAQQHGQFGAVALCQTTLGTPGWGNFALVAVEGDKLWFFERPDGGGTPRQWPQPRQLASGVRGAPAIIQSRFGGVGNLEVVVPGANGGFVYLWRNNDKLDQPWSAPNLLFPDLGKFDDVALIQSSFTAGSGVGNLELALRAGGTITTTWMPDNQPGQWQGPYHLPPTGAPSSDPWPRFADNSMLVRPLPGSLRDPTTPIVPVDTIARLTSSKPVH